MRLLGSSPRQTLVRIGSAEQSVTSLPLRLWLHSEAERSGSFLEVIPAAIGSPLAPVYSWGVSAPKQMRLKMEVES